MNKKRMELLRETIYFTWKDTYGVTIAEIDKRHKKAG